jgi:hypothetical protein
MSSRVLSVSRVEGLVNPDGRPRVRARGRPRRPCRGRHHPNRGGGRAPVARRGPPALYRIVNSR